MECDKKYILNVVWDPKTTKFVQLVQGQMSAEKYEAKFVTPQIISTKREKGRKFQESISPYIKSHMASYMMIDYTDILERALVIEGALGKSATERHSQQKRKSSGKDNANEFRSQAPKKPRTTPP